MPPTQLSAVQPSPKRKRDNAPTVPPLNTSLCNVSTPPTGSPTSPAADSPRNAVADQFRGMTIAPLPALPVPPLTPTDNLVRKKQKLGIPAQAVETTSTELSESDMASLDGEPGLERGTRDLRVHGEREVPETPQLQPGTDPRLSYADIVALPQPVVFASSPTESMRQTSNKHVSKSTVRSSQPRSRNKSPSPPSLTWKDNEITGHLVDPSTDPDDDGTGINGIGFKPTPQIAWARAQKRKQQLMDWRARETKEARAKRSERRRRGVGGAGSSSREGTVEREFNIKEPNDSRRAVRFAI